MGNKDIEKLADEIRHHNRKYWVDHKPEISDVDYDKLVNKLRAVAPLHVVLSEIVEDNSSHGTKFKHLAPMLSLDKLFLPEEVVKWAKGAGIWDDDVPGLVASYKIDGLSCSLHYEDGKLVRAVTRGDGEEGDDVTPNVMTISSIPRTLKSKRKFEVRGEVYMTNASFEENVARFDAKLALGEVNADDRPSNPRNLAAGSLKQKDPNITRERNLSFMGYACVMHDGDFKFNSENKLFQVLADLGFETPFFKLISKPEQIAEAIDEIGKNRKSLPYDTDGVVFGVNNIAKQRDMGVTGHHPRYKIAFKFAREQGETTVTKINWNTSRTGRVVPQIEMKPITLGGAVVTFTTGHNAKGIKEFDLAIGDKILMEREVIPYLVKKVDGKGGVVLPTECASCGNDLVWDGTNVDLLCMNIGGCPAQLQSYLEHYVSRKVVNIKGVGTTLIDKLLDAKLIKSPADFFRLTEDEIREGVERQGESSAKKVIETIAEHRKQGLGTFLQSLGIPDLGETVSQKLADKYKTLDDVLAADKDSLMTVDKVGEKIATAVIDGLKLRKARISELLKVVEIIEVKKVKGPLTGKSFCLTGKVIFEYAGKAYDSRPDIEDFIKSKGGDVRGDVSKDLSYLICGDEPGSKKGKAEKNKVNIIDGKALVKLLG